MDFDFDRALLALMGDGRQVAERGVAALAVVPGFAPREDGEPRRSAGGPDPGIGHLGLTGDEAALDQRVVQALAGPAHRADHTAGDTRNLVGRRVLGPAIGVMDESHAGAPGAEGHREGAEGEFRAQVVGHRPPHDAARVGVEEHRQVGQPACVAMSVLSPHQRRSGAGARKSRATRFGAGVCVGSAIGGGAPARRWPPTRPAARISRATRVRAQRTPAARHRSGGCACGQR